MYTDNHTISSLNINILKKHLLDNINYCFVETGTNLGSGIKVALSFEKFIKIYSIEIEEYFYNISKQIFTNNQNVILYNGDASIYIKEICENENLPCCFFLDAHGAKNSTLYKEIEYILARNNKYDVILIDDLRVIEWNLWWGKHIFNGNLQNLLNLFNNNFILEREDTFNKEKDMLVVRYKKENQ